MKGDVFCSGHSGYLAIWLRGWERCVFLLLNCLLLGLLALGDTLMAEVWQESLPALSAQLWVVRELSLDH